MIIDFHTHAFPDKIAKPTIEALAKRSNGTPYTDGTVLGLKDNIKKNSVDMAVVLPVMTNPKQFDSILRFAETINNDYAKEDNKLISFAGIHPFCEDIKGKIKLIKDKGFKGIKIHPDYQETYIDDNSYLEILKCAKDNDLIVVTHAGVDDGYKGCPVRCTPDRVKRVINKIGHEKFVLAHYGGNRLHDEVYNTLAGLNVYFDTAYILPIIDSDIFKKILFKHGEDKVLFATDCPWSDNKRDVEILKSFNLGKEIEDLIFYKNALKLIGE